MAGAGIRIKLEGKDAALASLRAAAAQADDPRGLWDNVGAVLAASTQARFERGEAPDGSAWPASIRATLQGGQTLIDSARLMQSITWNADAGGVDVGTNVLYAAIHQFGGTIKPVTQRALRFRVGDRWVMASEVTIPARPFLGLDRHDEVELEALARDWLLGPQGARDAAQ